MPTEESDIAIPTTINPNSRLKTSKWGCCSLVAESCRLRAPELSCCGSETKSLLLAEAALLSYTGRATGEWESYRPDGLTLCRPHCSALPRSVKSPVSAFAWCVLVSSQRSKSLTLVGAHHLEVLLVLNISVSCPLKIKLVFSSGKISNLRRPRRFENRGCPTFEFWKQNVASEINKNRKTTSVYDLKVLLLLLLHT